jgi:hypothetical protein
MRSIKENSGESISTQVFCETSIERLLIRPITKTEEFRSAVMMRKYWDACLLRIDKPISVPVVSISHEKKAVRCLKHLLQIKLGFIAEDSVAEFLKFPRNIFVVRLGPNPRFRTSDKANFHDFFLVGIAIHIPVWFVFTGEAIWTDRGVSYISSNLPEAIHANPVAVFFTINALIASKFYWVT